MSGGAKVLHVDGDAGERRALAKFARELGLGWRITPADSLAAARQRLAAEAFDVILTELRLADGEAFNLFPEGAVRTYGAVIMVTSQGGEAAAVQALRTGCSDYLIKQPDHAHFADLPARVASALDARRAEREFRETVTKLSDLFDGTSEIIQSVDPQGGLQFVNRRWRETFGYRDDEIAGINLFNLIHPDERAHCGDLFRRLMGGEDVGEIETKFVARDGRIVVLRGRATVRFQDGRPVATRTVFHDVTVERHNEERERRRQERGLRLQTNLLQLREQSEQELGTYLRLVTGSTLASLGLAASEVWILGADGARLERRSCHRAGAAEPDATLAGATADLAALLGALAGDSLVRIDRLDESPQSSGLAGTGLLPAGTLGVILVPVVLEGRPVGCIFFTHTEEGRAWEPEEERFGAAVAASIVLAMERERRRLAEKDNRELQSNLERLVAERTAALAESEFRLRQITENIGEVFYTVDLASGRFLYLSPAFTTIWGRPADQPWVSTAAWLDSIHEDDRAAAREFAARRVLGAAELEYRIHRPDGALRRVLDRSFSVHDARGSVYRAAGLAIDVTERRNADAGRIQRQRLEAIGNLAGGIAHDLNNALTPITLGLQLLRRKHPAEEQVYSRLLKSAAHGSDVIRQLLTFARGAGGERSRIRTADLIENIAALITSTFPRNIRLQVRCASDTWPVFGDSGHLQQVLLNLCLNARDAMPDGGALEVEATNLVVDAAYLSGVNDAQPGRYVVWRVRDTGVGIPEGEINQVFEPFFMSKGPNQSSGLGLSTAMRIVRDHGGFITVTSEPGRGANFRVHLPAAELEEERPASPVVVGSSAPFTTTASGAGRHLLVVDDEASVLETLCATLQAMGYRTSAAADGTEALIRAAEQRAVLDGMVTDLNMSGVDGLKLVRTVRHMLPRLPIVVISGRVDTSQQRELAQSGIGQIIFKPFTEEELAAALKRALATSPAGTEAR
jgi:two-component system cell cycle sensor histidine kinase/response regulator CckA